MIRISVVIPSYNASRTIEACLDSVIAQEFDNKEIIIVDGASSDGTVEMVESYASRYSYIKFVSERDAGIYDAMNKGIDKTSGEWIYFLGSDDTLADNRVLSDVWNVITVFPKAEFVYGDVRLVPSGRIYGGRFSWSRLYRINISHQAIFYKRSLFTRLGKYEIKYKVVADWVFNILCFKAGVRRKYINRIIANFSEAGLSSTNKMDVAFKNDFTRIKANFPFYINLWDYLKYRFK